MRLITYIPGGAGSPGGVLRVNVEVVRPSESVVFMSDAHGCGDKPLGADEVHCVSYGGAEALLRMLGIAEAGDVIVNGAILEDSFMRYYETARRLGSRLVGVADVGGRPGPRDLEIDGVPHVRVVHSGSIAFGPTLAIVVNHRPVNEYINDLLGVVERVPGAVRQCVDEGVVLGIYALMVGQSMTPWFPGARRLGSNGNNCNRHLREYANYALYKSLIKNGIHITGVNNHALMIRHLLRALTHW